MSERRKILWLVSWYPNKYDPFDGDFIQRHARAAALYDDIHVLFIKQFASQHAIEREWREENGLTEQVIYLPKANSAIGKIKDLFQWWNYYQQEAGAFIRKYRPAMVHVHIPWQVGVVALWVKRRYKTPYILTEHWGIYNHIVEDNIYTKPYLIRQFLRQIYREAVTFISVSRYVGEGVRKALLNRDYKVLPNVVDTTLFYYSPEKYERMTFLHVSNMVPLKNVEGILSAFGQFLSLTGSNAQLILVGNRDEKYPLLTEKMNLLNKYVFFKGEVPYYQVAEEMRKSHVLIVNSNIENSPCVIGEALCCGVPVIATCVGGVPELVNESNGILIPPGNSEALVAAIAKMKESLPEYNSETIASQSSVRFGALPIGFKIHQEYISR